MCRSCACTCADTAVSATAIQTMRECIDNPGGENVATCGSLRCNVNTIVPLAVKMPGFATRSRSGKDTVQTIRSPPCADRPHDLHRVFRMQSRGCASLGPAADGPARIVPAISAPAMTDDDASPPTIAGRVAARVPESGGAYIDAQGSLTVYLTDRSAGRHGARRRRTSEPRAHRDDRQPSRPGPRRSWQGISDDLAGTSGPGVR